MEESNKISHSLNAYCTAEAYVMPTLFQFLQKNYMPTRFKDVIHLSYPLGKDIFYFSYGTIVLWGFLPEEEAEILKELKEYEMNSLDIPEYDELTFSYGNPFKIYQDDVTLSEPSTLTKLAISYGISQSVKLTAFENKIKDTILKTRNLPEELVKKGKIPLTRKQISKKIGGLFLERSSINLHTDILDTPEFFWEYPELESLYRTTTNYLDLRPRVEVLNKRLNIVKELFEMLGGELNHRHSSRLEWIIILLIFVAVLVALFTEVLPL